MSSDPRIDLAGLTTVLQDVFAPWVQELNITIDDVAHGGITTRMPAAAKLSRIGNIVSGQAMTAMADTTMVLALTAEFGEFRPVATVDLSMTFMRVISASHVLCEARVRRAGDLLPSYARSYARQMTWKLPPSPMERSRYRKLRSARPS